MLKRDQSFIWTEDGVEGLSPITWGITEQANGLFAILVNVPGGILTGKQMGVLAEIVGDDGIIKNSRRLAPLLIVEKGRVPEALEKLKGVGLKVANLHSSVRNIVACPGKGFSSNSRGDTLELAKALDEEFYGTILPWDFKIGISGCLRNCSGVHCHDVGLMAELRGKYSLWIGGTESGMNPRHGTLIQKGVPREKVGVVIRAILEHYIESAEIHKEELGRSPRLYRVIGKVGLESFEQVINQAMA